MAFSEEVGLEGRNWKRKSLGSDFGVLEVALESRQNLEDQWKRQNLELFPKKEPSEAEGKEAVIKGKRKSRSSKRGRQKSSQSSHVFPLDMETHSNLSIEDKTLIELERQKLEYQEKRFKTKFCIKTVVF